ncbi:MAG TPA: hypothetical protein VIA62_07850 [Thermoanaerobaculia bacterium]|jgi:hypothetical protein|nr:hypothetical protein [Thermoanaerobaculia bacterium]
MNPAENWHTQSGVAETEPPAPAPALPAAAAPPVLRKNPGLAALLSLFPGMGNVYNGLYLRGITFFLLVASLIAVVARGNHELFGMAIAFFWIFNVIDAYRQATLINYGYAQDLGLLDLPRYPRASQGGLVAGILLTLIGLFAVLDRYFDVRLDWLLDLWPFALVAAGVWLIWSALRDRRRGLAEK